MPSDQADPALPSTQQDSPPEKSMRLKRREERMKFVRDAKGPQKVRVTPAREELRRALKHPSGGGFRSSGSVEWPNDTFTRRRIKDGDVTVEKREPNTAAQRPAPEAQRTAGAARVVSRPSTEPSPAQVAPTANTDKPVGG
jgi:hypothetical protein